jgi:tetratricopeptide (TPR) repeat protein
VIKTPTWLTLLKSVLVLSFLLPVSSCSVRKNNILSREYHKTLAHYNGYFNARERVKQGAKTLAASKPDRYDRILSVFRYGDATSAKAVFPDMDEAIKKVSLVIQRHSMDIDGKERNKWIPECYLLIGIAQFYKHDFWTAIESFQYVAAQYRNEPIKYDALMWLTQCYLQLGKMPDADYLLNSMKDDPKFPVKRKSFYNAIYANYHLQNNDYNKAAEHLEKAVAMTKKRAQRQRYAFILGQIYQKQGEYERAITKYDLVLKSSPTYEMSFNARVNRARCVDVNSANAKEMKRMLVKMLSDEKNQEYLDQIYYALAEISLKEEKTPEAIDLLKKSTASSVSNTNQKALSYLKLAEIYFKKPDYKLSQQYYDSTATFISEDHPDYYTIINTKNNLTKLIQYLNIIQVEDSLQALAALDPATRLRLIEERVKAEDEEKMRLAMEKKEQERLEKEKKAQMEGDPGFMSQNSASNQQLQSGGGWYFSNPSAVSFGFNEFIRLWGNRKLEDNWRRSNKTSLVETSEPDEEGGIPVDSLAQVTEEVRDSIMAANSAKRTKTYLDAVPLTPEQKAKSDEKIVEAYYNVGLLYKEQLRDNKEARDNFETLMKRYPENQYKLPTMYNLYRVYLALDDMEKADYYKNIILTDYSDSDYAKIILNPDYYKEQQRKVAVQKVFYENTYRAYLNKQYADVIERKSMADSLFPGSDLAPKFEMLKALAIGQTKPIPEFESALKYVVARYPQDTVTIKAKEILALINPSIYGRKDSVPSQVSEGGPAQVTPANKPKTDFRFKADTLQYVLLVFPNNNVIGSNTLKVAVSNYNTKYYSIKKLQTSNSFLGTEFQFVMIRQFTDKEDAVRYLDGLLSDPEALVEIDVASLRSVIISPDNLLLLMQSRDLDGYEAFYEEKYLN